MAVVRADTYELNFRGNLEAKLAASRAAAGALESQFGEAKAALKTLQDAANEELFAKSPIAKARADVRALGADFRAAGAQAKAAERDFAAAAKAAEKKATAEQDARNKTAVQGYQYQQANAAADAQKSAAFWKEGGDALADGAKFALGAAVAIGAASAGLVAAGLKLGVESTAQKQRNIAVLDRLTGGQGELAEQVSKQLAAETGVGEDKAMERVKALIQAKFGRGDTETVFKAAADIGAGLDEGKADAFLAILEKVQHEGTATEKALKGLSGVGIDRSAVLEGLRQAGETAEQVEARLKGGKVAAADFAKAASAAATRDFGGIAGKDLASIFNRAKIAAGDLFDGMDEGLDSVKGLGALVNDALSGKEGEGLKAAISAAGNEVLNLTKNITAADIRGAFAVAGEAATTAAAAIKAAAGVAGELWNVIKQVSGKGGHLEDAQGGGGMGDEAERELFLRNKAFNDKIAAQQAAQEKEKAATAKAAHETGVAYGEGFAKGIEASAGKPIAAAAATGKGVAAAGNTAIKAHSPSREAEQSGQWYDEGWERGIAGHAGKPAAAARAMGGGIVKAGGAAALAPTPASSNAAPAGGDVAIQFAPVFQFAATTPDGVRAEMQKAIEEMTPAMLARLLAGLRQNGRDSREGPRT